MGRYYTRNTPTEHVCRTCQGAGELTRNNSWDQDPQCEFAVPCTEPLCCDGWVRWAPIDPLELLAAARPGHLRRNPIQSQRYGAAFARAFTDVPLPQIASAMPWQVAA
ncbi:hypothetical protein ACP93_02515 [Xanthomonas sp. NCPPB 1128]|uniref:hypothetical protein n=1 Tax=Xanthomonas sp. NCPPB 1128 TaxID=1775876 RepID=UPI00065AD943|nr:hypothetical protein [Xanthomonas sp. NCPPB 1128]KMM77058.1 hypothetical protein ACP93_02250 [Xanthomonas sp. NCPPB 1128]KMM77102.1 hypothetical protein ACP93_02515 [Xanthomonas sp. NCPPB 1128]